jgi:hypothetical protein
VPRIYGAFPFQGVLYRDWRRLIGRIGPLSRRQRGRIARVVLRSLLNEALHFVEQRQLGARVAEQEVRPPLVVVGLARSGTTLLQQLLCADPRFAYPTHAQVFNPHTFLTREGWTHGFLARSLRALNLLYAMAVYGNSRSIGSSERGLDRVLVGPAAPEEDDFALLASGLSPMLALAFPNDYERFLTRPEGRRSWQSAWLAFLRKVSFCQPGKRLLLKSPPHLERLPWILELFPQAQFLFISRDPSDLYRSTARAVRTLRELCSFQDYQEPEPESLLPFMRKQAEVYLRDRRKVPPGQLHELRYEDLVGDPEAELERAYRALSLPDFEAFRPALRGALQQREGYRTNLHAPLQARTQSRIGQEMAAYMRAFGYPGDAHREGAAP